LQWRHDGRVEAVGPHVLVAGVAVGDALRAGERRMRRGQPRRAQPCGPTSRSAGRAATAAVVGALGGRELGVLATIPAPVTVHLVAARAAPDVAVLLEAVVVTSAAKELHAAVAVPVSEVKEPAVNVVAGCLEALVDLLSGLSAP
jgi:hypothetical protein